MARETKAGFRVYWQGEHPKPKRQFHPGTFEKRQQARVWCRNHAWYPGLTIVGLMAAKNLSFAKVPAPPIACICGAPGVELRLAESAAVPNVLSWKLKTGWKT